jgi:hypothetical protein
MKFRPNLVSELSDDYEHWVAAGFGGGANRASNECLSAKLQ